MDFSVIIPTYNRSQILALTLDALAQQSSTLNSEEPLSFEVVVIDDGSTDSTREHVKAQIQNYPVPLRYFFQTNRKQAAARNFGASKAYGTFLLFLGDDIVPCQNFLHEHRKSHNSRDPNLAAIGYTCWPNHFSSSSFLEYIGEQGWQFGFSMIEDPENLPFNFFYSSNLSLPQSLFRGSGGFDESFDDYGWEDVELGLRLKKKGMKLVYNRRAIAYHDHRINLRSFVKRQRKVGRSAWTLYGKHPETADFLNIEETPSYSLLCRIKMWGLTQICSLVENLSWPDLSSFYPDLMSYHYNRGIAERRDDPS